MANTSLCITKPMFKRIDRNPDGSKNHMIDFLQIPELADKYMGTNVNQVPPKISFLKTWAENVCLLHHTYTSYGNSQEDIIVSKTGNSW